MHIVNRRRGVTDLSEKKWLVLYVGSRKEKVVLQSLLSLRFNAFVPLRERHYRYSSKAVVRHLPILPGYVFVEADVTEASAILGITFVFGFLKMGSRYAKVTEKEMAHLRCLCSSKALDWCEQSEEHLTEGTLLEIIRGPLAGLRGRFVRQKNQRVFLVSFGDVATQLGTFELSMNDVTPVLDTTSGAA